MEACNFGHKKIVELLLAVPSLDLEAMNIRGQRADEVAASRGINISYVILFFLYLYSSFCSKRKKSRRT